MIIDTNIRRVQSLDDRRNLIFPGDYEETIVYCINHFIDLCKKNISEKNYFSVALSGGSTPKSIFQLLCSDQFKNEIEWDKILFFWSDERAVPPENSESNYKMAMDSGIKNMPIKQGNVFRMKAEHDIEKSAKEYEELISKKLNSKPFDLVMLGVGDDGHTASLFPNTEALKEAEKLVVANYVPQKNTWRMTLTFKAINQSKNIVLYVLGDKKKNILKKALFPEPGSTSYPSQMIGSSQNKALWIIDKAAAANLKNLT